MYKTPPQFKKRYKRLLREGRSVSKKAYKRLNKWKPRWEHIIIAFLLGLLLAGKSSPTIIHSQFPVLESTKPLVAIKEPSYSPQMPLESILHELKPYGTYGSGFVPGQCTWGVASRLPVTWSGNATDWSYQASMQGYEVSTTPRVGSIAVSHTDSWWGHVAIVTAISDNGITVWDMNYSGPYSINERTANYGEFTDFIYF